MPARFAIPFKLGGLDHIVLRVLDMNRALDFYCGVLGAVEERRIEDMGLVQLRAGSSMIDLMPGDQGAGASKTRNMEHFALTIAPFDEAALISYLRAAGIAAEPAARRYGAQGFGPSVYIEDPDGNIVELKGPPEAD